MSFWLEQARSERNSLLWLFLFILLTCLVLALLLGFLGLVLPHLPGHSTHPLWKDQRLWMVGATILSLILFITLLTWQELSRGSARFAQSLGATPLPEQGRTVQEQLFYDLCCEMSAASLVRMPQLYVFPREKSINAMVAGCTPDDCVLIVTDAALQSLDRLKMQALIAHEFSHLLAGDALLNIRLILTLSGLQSLYQLGETCVEWSETDDGLLMLATWALYLLGQGIKGLGWTGLLFGRLLRAGLNREREFLADANAVRLTRFPAAMLDLLFYLMDHAEEQGNVRCCGEAYRHMFFFSKRHRNAWTSLHPTLESRLLALDPAAMARWRARHRKITIPGSNTTPGTNRSS